MLLIRSAMRKGRRRSASSVEEEAGAVVQTVLEDKGYRALSDPYYLRMNGDVDVVLPMEDENGRPVWVVVEAKVRLGLHTVERWARRIQSSGFQARLRKHGVEGPYLAYVYGMRVDVSARKTAQKYGIGVMSSQGEQVAPKGLLQSSDK